MSRLATVVAVPLVAFSTAPLRPSSCKNFVGLSILFASPLPLLVVHVVVFQPFGLLIDAVYEHLGVDNVAGDPRSSK